MSIKVRCPRCQKPIEVQEALVGQTIRCVHCRQPLQLDARRQTSGETQPSPHREALTDDDVLAFLGPPPARSPAS